MLFDKMLDGMGIPPELMKMTAPTTLAQSVMHADMFFAQVEEDRLAAARFFAEAVVAAFLSCRAAGPKPISIPFTTENVAEARYYNRRIQLSTRPDPQTLEERRQRYMMDFFSFQTTGAAVGNLSGLNRANFH